MSIKNLKNTINLTIAIVLILAVVLELFLLLLSSPSTPTIIDSFELISAIILSILMLVFIRFSFLKYVTLGVALALLSWSGGELFSLSYRHITETAVPFPSIADFGYVGFYLMLSSSLGILKRVDADGVNKGLAPYLVFLLILTPVIILWNIDNHLIVNISNFIYAFLNALIIYQALILIKLRLYPYIISSVIFIATVGMLFMVVVSISPANVHYVTLLFPLGLAGLLFGIVKHNGDN